MDTRASGGKAEADQVLSDLPRLTVDEIITKHGLEDDRDALRDIARLVQHRRVVRDRKLIETLEKQAAHFSIQYDSNESIEGDLFGIRQGERRPVVIWGPAFGMPWDAGLQRMYLQDAKDKPLIVVCYDAAGRPGETTFTRFCQDMDEVIRFVSGLPYVDSEAIGIASISYTCSVTMKVAAEHEPVRSMFCMLPSLDVVDMLNKFRQEQQRVSDAIQRFGRAEEGWRYRDWDRTEKCDYFYIRGACAAHLVDIFVHPEPKAMRSSGFIANLREIAVRPGAHIRFGIGDDDCLIDFEDTTSRIDRVCGSQPELSGHIEIITFKGGRRWHSHGAKSRGYNAVANYREMRRVIKAAWNGFEEDLCKQPAGVRTHAVSAEREAPPQTQIETEFERLLRNAPVAVLVTRLDGQILYANDEAYRMFGYDYGSPEERAQLDVKNIQSLYKDPSDRDVLLETLNERGEVVDCRLCGVNRSGEDFLGSVSCHPIDFRGQQCLETTIRDITMLVHYEDVAAQRQLEREQEIKDRDDFLDHVSHDLKGPANRLEGLINLIEQSGTLEPYRQALHSNAHLIKRLTGNLLEFSRITAGRMHVSPTLLRRQDICDLLDELRSAYAGVLEEESKTLNVTVAPGLPAIKTDESKLEAILLNLIDNAVKFTENGKGKIQVTVETAGPDHVAFLIQDNGEGIAPKEQEGIFGKYQQAGHKSARQGFGIGLFIAKTYTARLGGALSLKSRAGGPTVFRLELPVRRDNATEADERSNC